MKVPPALVLVTTIICFSQAIRLPDSSWAVEVKTPSKSRVRRLNDNSDSDPKDCQNKYFSCADCNTNRVCHPSTNGITHYKDTPCPSERPFCDPASGTCVTSAALHCGANDTFTCLDKNQFYPDADCTKYHYCDDKYSSLLFTCIAAGTVYDAEQKRCVAGGDCGKFDCNDQNSLKKATHSNFPRFYAMCKGVKENKDVPLVIGACPLYYKIDPKLQICEPDCQAHGNGNIPDFKDCHKYWSCTRTKLEDDTYYMIKKLNTCPSGEAFDDQLFLCVPDTDGKICSK